MSPLRGSPERIKDSHGLRRGLRFFRAFGALQSLRTLEIAIFSVANEQIVWAARMKTTNPKSLRVFLDEMVEMGSKELKKQGLVS